MVSLILVFRKFLFVQTGLFRELYVLQMACLEDDMSSMQGKVQVKGHHARQLKPDEITKLDKDTKLVTDFKQQKLEKEAQKNWDLFYKRNTTKFFKDRHWTTREFKELCGKQSPGSRMVILEVGCGVGNFIFPLLEEDPDLFFYACDFSPRAVQFVKDNPLYNEERCHAFQCDVTRDPLYQNIPASSVDIVSMIFVLSAIHPDKMLKALENIATVLKPGGVVLFRDYGLYDHAMLRFTPGHKLSDRFYVRQDGTRAYYFSEEKLAELFIRANFGVVSNEYVLRETVNRKEGLCVPRVFIQGKFIKETCSQECPITPDSSNSSSEVGCDDLKPSSRSTENMECSSHVSNTVSEHSHPGYKTDEFNRTSGEFVTTQEDRTVNFPVSGSPVQSPSSTAASQTTEICKTVADISIETAERLIINGVENGQELNS